MIKVQELQDELSRYSEFSKPVSYIEFVKYANQAYKNDGPKYYTLPQRRDLGRISSLVRKSEEINNLEVKLNYMSASYNFLKNNNKIAKKNFIFVIKNGLINLKIRSILKLIIIMFKTSILRKK